MTEGTEIAGSPIVGSSAESAPQSASSATAAAPSVTGAPAPAVEPPPAREPAPDPRLAELESRLAAQDKAIAAAKADALTLLADRLGVLPQYRAYLPQVDPFSAEGKAELQKWAAERPEIIRSAVAPVSALPSELEQKLAKAEKNPFVNTKAWRAAVAARSGEVR